MVGSRHRRDRVPDLGVHARVTTLRNGHGWMFFFGMFFFGIFIPVFWLIGAFMRPSESAVVVLEPAVDVTRSQAP